MIDVRKDLPSDERIVMDMQFMGWPFPALKMQHMWWPDMQPWQTSQEPDPAMQLCWQGVLLNPLIFAGALWLAFMGLPSFWLVVRRLHRIRRRMCPACAYPVGTAKNCSECGSPLPDKLQAAASPGTVQPS